MLYGLPEEDRAVLEQACEIMTARHGASGALAGDMLLPMMVALASNAPSTGGQGTRGWIAALRAFGECLVSIARMLDAGAVGDL